MKATNEKPLKDNKNIIYEMQSEIYEKSVKFQDHHKLYQKVLDEKNIRYAISRISTNTGRNTPGPNGRTFKELMEMPYNDVLTIIRKELRDSKVRIAREVEIPKANGKMRKLGITNIEERIAQQCVLNVLECILEPQFARHSYGFRKNISTKHCVSRLGVTLRVMRNKRWVYDCDLENFFGTVKIDNVLTLLRINHNIKDGRFLKLIKELMWLNIKNKGKITKYEGIGLAQGTILGPVLANVQFNDFEKLLDSISMSESEKKLVTPFLTRNNFDTDKYIDWKRKHDRTDKYFISMFRYADDFILISSNQYDLNKVIEIFEIWCKNNSLKINKEKTKIISGKEIKLDFLGYHIKANDNGLIISIKDYQKKKQEIGKTIKQALIMGKVEEINQVINGTYYYYDIATNLMDLGIYISKILYKMSKRRDQTICKIRQQKGHDVWFIDGIEGRKTVIDIWTLRKETTKSPKYYIMNTNYWKPNETNRYDVIEWCTRIIESRAQYTNTRVISFVLGKVRQQKKEPVLGVELLDIEPDEIDIHHRLPKHMGGKDDFNNLVMLHRRVHVAIHANEECDVGWYKPNYNKLKKIIWEEKKQQKSKT